MIRCVPALALLAVLSLVACSATPLAATPTAPVSAGAGSLPPVTASPFAAATLDPSFSPSPTGCPPRPSGSGAWSSDRLVAIETSANGIEDRVTFRFGPPSRPGATASIRVGPASGPFTSAGSGRTVEVAGSLHMELRAEGLELADAQGRPTYDGAQDLRPGLVTVKQITAIDASEGVMRWVIGAEVSCVSLGYVPGAGTITLGFTNAVP